MTIEEPERVSYEEARKRGLSGLLDDGAEHPIAIETGKGGVVLVPRQLAEQIMRALEARDDLYDMVQAIARLATDSGERYSLDEVIEELGLTQAEIDAAD